MLHHTLAEFKLSASDIKIADAVVIYRYAHPNKLNPRINNATLAEFKSHKIVKTYIICAPLLVNCFLNSVREKY